MIVVGNVADGHTIASSAGCIFNPTRDHVISRRERGELFGGVIFKGYTGSSIAGHIAGIAPGWINRDMLWVMFDYPFVQLKCLKLLGEVPSRNLKALDFNFKLGFKVEARISDVFPDGDLIILSMRREDCRWLTLRPRGA